MAKTFIRNSIKCPYYKYETGGRRIHCNGVADPKGSTIHYIPHAGLRHVWLERYCKSAEGCKRCYIYKALEEGKNNDRSDGNEA